MNLYKHPYKVRHSLFAPPSQYFWLLISLAIILFISTAYRVLWMVTGHQSLTSAELTIVITIIFGWVLYTRIRPRQPRHKYLKAEYPLAWERVKQLLAHHKVNCSVLVDENAKIPYVTGYWGDVVITKQMAEALQLERVDKVDEAVLLHEIAHVLSADSRKLFVLTSIIRVIATALRWFLIILMPIFILEVLTVFFPGIPSFSGLSGQKAIPEFIEVFIYLIIFICLILFLLWILLSPFRLYKNILQREIESFADLTTVEFQGTNEYLKTAIIRSVVQNHFVSPRELRDSATISFSPIETQGNSIFYKIKILVSKKLRGLYEYLSLTHPNPIERIRRLNSGIYLPSSATLSLFIGFTVPLAFLLSLDINPMWIGFCTVLIGYFGLSRLTLENFIWTNNSQKLSFGATTKQFLSFCAGLACGLLSLIPFSILLYSSELTFLLEVDLLESELLQSLLQILLLSLFLLYVMLGFNFLILKDVFQWYSSSLFKGEFRLLSLLLLFIPYLFSLAYFIFKITPAIFEIAYNKIASLLCAFPFIGAVTPIAIFPLLDYIFRRSHYRNICPNCKGRVDGPYIIGKTCEKCGENLHAWLFDKSYFRDKNLAEALWDDYANIGKTPYLISIIPFIYKFFIPCWIISWVLAIIIIFLDK